MFKLNRFRYPVPPAPRTAVLAPGFRSSRDVRVFADGWSEKVEQFAPAAIAAPLPLLQALSRRPIPSVKNSVIVLGSSDGPRLSPADRERLWRAFRVPIFEQIVNGKGELLAAECEAHDGLHIESESLAADPDAFDPTPCACGRKTPRLRPAHTPHDLARRISAYAR